MTAAHEASVTVVPRAAQRRMRWKNGLGWTTELAVRPAGGGEFDWRASIAEVDADSEFSRVLTLNIAYSTSDADVLATSMTP
jgi:environmental stress-induced protein Ves